MSAVENIWAVVRIDRKPGSFNYYHRVFLSWDLPGWADEAGLTAKEAAESFLEQWEDAGGKDIFKAVELKPVED